MIIDTHVHIGIYKQLGFNMPENILLESIEKYHINFSLVSDIEAAEFDHNLKPLPKETQITQKQSLLRVLKFTKDNADKIGAFVWVKPASETVDEEFKELIMKNREFIYGIKVHPFHSMTAVDDKAMQPFLELAQELHLPVVAHTGGCEEANAIHMYNAAKMYPDVDFVMVHMGLGTDNQEAINLLGKLPNLYGDTTWVPIKSTVQVVNLYGSEKILFGSDNPIDGLDTYHNNPKGEISIYPSYFNDLESMIGTEGYENIMYKNAMRIFNIKEDKLR